jgi:hypothetical protein
MPISHPVIRNKDFKNVVNFEWRAKDGMTKSGFQKGDEMAWHWAAVKDR